MRRDGIPYVKNPSTYYPPIDYKKLNLKELTEKFIKQCAKANGSVSACSQCQSPCEYGKRAIQLVANEVYSDPPVPLYGGKTLIERAKEENRLRREKEELKKVEEKMEIKQDTGKRKYLRGDDWWNASIEYGDQVEYLMKEHGYSRTRAKQAIYRYRSRKGLSNGDTPIVTKDTAPKNIGPTVKIEPTREVTPKEEPVKETKVNAGPKNDILIVTMEQKMSELMRSQDEYKKQVDKYTKLYNEVKEQIDVLCKAMDIFN